MKNNPQVAKSRSLWAACLTHALHDGYTDGLYAFLPIWQSQFGLSYAGLAVVRALYYGTTTRDEIFGTLKPCRDLDVRRIFIRSTVPDYLVVRTTSVLINCT